MPQMKEAVRKTLYFKAAGIRGYKYNIHQRTSEDRALNEKHGVPLTSPFSILEQSKIIFFFFNMYIVTDIYILLYIK